jgi:hypothetical protein
MGIWGDAYGPEGEWQTTQTSTYAPLAVPTSHLIFDGSRMDYLPFHLQLAQPSLNITITSLPRAQDHPLYYVGIYTLIGLATGLVAVLSIVVMFAGALRASRLLFNRLLDGVVRATMRWHVSLFAPAPILTI